MNASKLFFWFGAVLLLAGLGCRYYAYSSMPDVTALFGATTSSLRELRGNAALAATSLELGLVLLILGPFMVASSVFFRLLRESRTG